MCWLCHCRAVCSVDAVMIYCWFPTHFGRCLSEAKTILISIGCNPWDIQQQMISAGPAGTDLVQALQLTFVDISDYDRIFEMIGIYHAALSPEFAKDYTLEMATEDFQILMAFALAGMCGAIGPYTEGLKDDLENDLWTLCEFMIPRIGKCNTSLKVLEYVKGIEARV